MLRLCLTLSVLLGQQVCGTRASGCVVEDMSTVCYPNITDIPYAISTIGNQQGWTLWKLQEMVFDMIRWLKNSNLIYPSANLRLSCEVVPSLKWVYMVIHPTDLQTATDTALDGFFDYSHFYNFMDLDHFESLIIYAPFENGKIKPEYTLSVSIPVDFPTPPEPRDPFHIYTGSAVAVYDRTFEQNPSDYGRLANEFKKDLENEGCSFDSSGVFFAWSNRYRQFHIAFEKK